MEEPPKAPEKLVGPEMLELFSVQIVLAVGGPGPDGPPATTEKSAMLSSPSENLLVSVISYQLDGVTPDDVDGDVEDDW